MQNPIIFCKFETTNLKEKLRLVLKNQFLGHRGSIYSLLPWTSETLLSAGSDGWVAQWDMTTQNRDGTLLAQTDSQIFCMALDHNRNLLLCGTLDGHLLWLNMDQKVILRKSAFHQKPIYSILVQKDYVYTASGDGYLSKWSLDTQMPVLSRQLCTAGLRSLHQHPNGSDIWVGDAQGVIHQVSHLELITLSTTEAHQTTIFSMAISPDQDYLWTGGKDAQLIKWRIHDQGLEKELHIPAHWFTINALTFIDEQSLISASRDKRIRVWNTLTGSVRFSIEAITGGHIHSVNTLHFDVKRQTLFSGGDDQSIKIWSLE